jgi:hypothetical protein
MNKKNVLIYSHVPIWEKHHVESVDLAFYHTKRGDNVFFLSCENSLPS